MRRCVDSGGWSVRSGCSGGWVPGRSNWLSLVNLLGLGGDLLNNRWVDSQSLAGSCSAASLTEISLLEWVSSSSERSSSVDWVVVGHNRIGVRAGGNFANNWLTWASSH